MARIILQDMKLNKERRKTIMKKEIGISPKQIREEIYHQQEKIHKEEIKKSNDISKEKPASAQAYGEAKEESKIDEYFRNRKNSEQRLQRTPQIQTKPKILHKFTVIFFIFSLIVGGIYWSGNIFQKTNINITSKHQLITYNNKQFIASKNQSDNLVNFEIMITSDKKVKSIILTESKEVSLKAEGSITLYNEFSTKPEKLSVGTYLSDNDGKAYKTNNTVTLPGYKIDKDKKMIPGQVVVEITSFLAGSAYNGAPSDFHINSFKGTTKYNKIYGKLKTPLVGGALGLVYILDDKSKSNIDSIANSSFKEALLEQVKSLVPEGYILYKDAMTFTYKIENNILSETPEKDVEIEGVLSVVLLKEKSLIDNIIKISLPNIKGDELKEIKISDLSKLSFNFTNKDQLITKDMSSFSFFLSGSVDAIWNPDEYILKTKLLGIHKNDVLSIFRQDPGVSSAIIKIFPPWQKYLPNDLSKINIIID